MSLPARQRRVLDRIERTLHGSDPRLAALYAIFGRLARDEEMPPFEQLRHGVLTGLARVWLVLAASGAWLRLRLRPRSRQRARTAVQQRTAVKARSAVRPRPAAWSHTMVRPRTTLRTQSRVRRRFPLKPGRRVVILYPIAIALAVATLVLAAKFSPSRTCLPARAVAAAKNIAKTSLCKPPVKMTPLTYGH